MQLFKGSLKIEECGSSHLDTYGVAETYEVSNGKRHNDIWIYIIQIMHTGRGSPMKNDAPWMATPEREEEKRTERRHVEATSDPEQSKIDPHKLKWKWWSSGMRLLFVLFCA